MRRILSALGPGGDRFRQGSIALFESISQLRTAAGISEEDGKKPDALSHGDPRVRVAYKLETLVWPLFLVYLEPALFFTKILPQLYPEDFDPEKIGPFENPADKGEVGYLIETWGPAVLLNPRAYDAFVAQCRTYWTANVTLSEALDRVGYDPKGGRPSGSGRDLAQTKAAVYEQADRAARLNRTEWGAVRAGQEVFGKQEGIKPSSVKKRMQRAPRKK